MCLDSESIQVKLVAVPRVRQAERYSGSTEFSIIWYPNSMEFVLAKEDLVRKILDAPFAIYNRFSFGELFQ